MAGKEGIHSFTEQMFHDYLLVPSTRNEEVNKTAHAFMELIIKSFGVGSRKDETMNGEHT